MAKNIEIDAFLSRYDKQVSNHALKLRQLLLTNLPDIIEQIDPPAKMIAHCYGQKYADLICVIIPSKKGMKLGFNRGAKLLDPDNLLEGKGKISRYIEIKSESQITSQGLKKLLKSALALFKTTIKVS